MGDVDTPVEGDTDVYAGLDKGIWSLKEYEQGEDGNQSSKLGVLLEYYSDVRNAERNQYIRQAFEEMPQSRLMPNGGVRQQKEVYAKDVKAYLEEHTPLSDTEIPGTKSLGPLLSAFVEAGKAEEVGASSSAARYDISDVADDEDAILTTLRELEE